MISTPASALDEKPRWFADQSDDEAVALWGIPETDAVGFSLRCEGGGAVVMAPALYAVEEPEVMPDVAFTVDGEAYVRPVTLRYSERDAAWQAVARVGKTDALIAALRRGSKLTYDFAPPLRDGDMFSLSLSGSARAIDAALKRC